MRRLGCRPPGIGAAFRRVAFDATGDRDAPDLNSGRRGTNGDIVRKIRGQASVAHGTHDAEPTEDLHCARADVVASHAGWLAGGARLGDGHANAAAREVYGQRQPNRPTANHQNLGIYSTEHGRALKLWFGHRPPAIPWSRAARETVTRPHK